MECSPLSEQLFRSISPDLFRPLVRLSVGIYVDCAQRLVEEAGEAGRLPHKEALEIVREVIAAHPLTVLSEDEGLALKDSRQRAGVFFG